jgi:hypothetical protein
MAKPWWSLGLLILCLMGIFSPALAAQATEIEPSVAESLLSAIPKDGELTGWIRDGAPTLCFDESSLSENINGAAPYYLERGAIAVLFQYFIGPTAGQDVRIEIYRMRDESSARGLYAEITKDRPASKKEEIKEIGQGRHLDQALLGVYLLEFYEGPFFMRIEGRGEGSQAKRTVIEFALHLCPSLKAQGHTAQ